MDIGSVSFFNDKLLKFANASKDNAVSRKFKKMQQEKEITYMKESYEDYQKEEQKTNKSIKEKQRQTEIENKRSTQKKRDELEYRDLFKGEMRTNKDDDDDDFM